MTKITLQATLSTIAICTVFAVSGNAKCGFSKTPPAGAPSTALLSMMAKMRPPTPAATPKDQDGAPAPEPSIVGLWVVNFVEDGQIVDQGFDVWSSDGTETLNDAVPPATGNVCLGAWSKTSPLTYSLNHPSWIYDDTNTMVVAMAFIREHITLDSSGNSFSGDVTIDVIDLMGNQLDHEVGTVSAQRITADTDPSQIIGMANASGLRSPR